MSSALNPSLATLANTSSPKRSLAWYLSWGILLVLLAASWKGADMRPFDLWNDSGNMVSYAAEFGGADKNLDWFYAASPRLTRYSIGLREPREILIRFSLYQRM